MRKQRKKVSKFLATELSASRIPAVAHGEHPEAREQLAHLRDLRVVEGVHREPRGVVLRDVAEARLVGGLGADVPGLNLARSRLSNLRDLPRGSKLYSNEGKQEVC